MAVFSTLQTALPAILLVVGTGALYRLYAKVFYCRKEFRHLPHVPLLNNIIAILQNKGYEERYATCWKDVHVGKPVTREYYGPQGWVISINTSENVKAITNHTEIFTKLLLVDTLPGSLAASYFGSNIVFSNNTNWHFYRSAITPAFKRGWKVEQFEERCDVLFECIEDKLGKPVNITEWIVRYTLDNLGLSILSTDFDSIRHPKSKFPLLYRKIMKDVLNVIYITLPFLESRSNPWRRPTYDMIDEFDTIFSETIQKRRAMKTAGEELPPDLLSSLIEEYSGPNEVGEKIVRSLTDQEIRDNLNVSFFGGHETTATTLTSAIHHLGIDQDAQDKARKAVLEAYAALPEGEPLPNIPYIEAIMSEVSRLYPALAHLTERVALHDTVLPSGLPIPKGQTVMVNLWALHRDPAQWGNDADKFRPERHLAYAHLPRSQHPVMYPFGIGSRNCLGKNLALTEMRTFIVRMLQRYKWRSVGDSGSMRFKPTYVLSPRDTNIIIERL